MDNNFANWKFKIHGLVENPLELSLTDLHAMKKQMQITEHSCIQGWTAIGEWGGVSMNYIISLCRPLPQARYVVFYSYQYTLISILLSVYSYQYTDGTQFYEAIYIELAKHHQTILAYEMNGEPLSVPYGRLCD
jgi:methionine sulfoxide reductase catalytic subunit